MIRSIGAAVGGRGLPAGVQSQMMNQRRHRQQRQLQQRHPQFDQRALSSGRPTRAAATWPRAVGNLPQLDGAAATDYTVYTKNDLTLRRGEKAILTLFVKKIKYTHIYRWSPPAAMEHSLVLLNQTDSAWTTGPCLALNGDQPLSEDLLKYTPKGGRGELPVTTAINVGQRQDGTRGRSQAQGLFAADQRQLRPGHAGRQAEAPQLREADGRYRDQQPRCRASR